MLGVSLSIPDQAVDAPDAGGGGGGGFALLLFDLSDLRNLIKL